MDAVELAVTKSNTTEAFPSGDVTCEMYANNAPILASETGNYDTNDLFCYQTVESANKASNHTPVVVDIKGDVPTGGQIKFHNGKIVNDSDTYLLMSDGNTYVYDTNNKLVISNNSGGSSVVTTWTHTDTDSDGVLDVGEVVTASNGESFYVIKTPESNESIVPLLSMYNLKSDGSDQDTTGANNPSAFSSANYWSSETNYPADLNDITSYPVPVGEASIITLAKTYGESLGVTGRLMRLDEVEALGGDASVSYTTSGCPDWINSQGFWFASAVSVSYVWNTVGDNGSINSYGLSYDSYDFDYTYGVRPVVEVPLSSIE